MTAVGAVKLAKRKITGGFAYLELTVPITLKPTAGFQIVAVQRIDGEIDVVYHDSAGKKVQNPGRYTYTIRDIIQWRLEEKPEVDGEITISLLLASQKVIDTPGYKWEAEYDLKKPIVFEVSEVAVNSNHEGSKSMQIQTIELSASGLKVAAK